MGRRLRAILACLVVVGCNDTTVRTDSRHDDVGERVARLEREVAALREQVAALRPAAAVETSMEGCLLTAMKGIASDLAAEIARTACLRRFEQGIPPAAAAGLAEAKAWYEKISAWESGLRISLNNGTGYDITELVVALVDRSTLAREDYAVHSFPAPPPTTGGIRDGTATSSRTTTTMIAEGRREFVLPIRQSVKDATKFFDRFSWQIVSAKGIPQGGGAAAPADLRPPAPSAPSAPATPATPPDQTP